MSWQPVGVPHPRAAAAAILLAYAVSRYLMATSLHMPDPLHFFLRFAKHAALPEYGPLANLIAYLTFTFRWPGNLGAANFVFGSQGTEAALFLLGSKTMALLVDMAVFSILVTRLRVHAIAAYLACSTLLYPLWLDRFDFYIGALLLASVALPGGWKAAAQVAAGLIKFPFLALVAIDWLRAPTRAALRLAVIALGGATAILLIASVLAGPERSIGQFFVQAERTVQFEGLIGNFLVVGAMHDLWSVRIVEEWGATHVHLVGTSDAALRAWSRILLVAGVGISAWRILRWGTEVPYALSLLLAVTAYTAFNPIGSPQYAILIAMLGPVALAERTRHNGIGLAIVSLYCLASAAGIALFPFSVDPPPLFVVSTLIRNLILVAFWGYLLTCKRQ